MDLQDGNSVPKDSEAGEAAGARSGSVFLPFLCCHVYMLWFHSQLMSKNLTNLTK